MKYILKNKTPTLVWYCVIGKSAALRDYCSPLPQQATVFTNKVEADKEIHHRKLIYDISYLPEVVE